MKKFSKGVFRGRFNISFATSQFLFINLVSFIKASWVTIDITDRVRLSPIKLLCFTNQKQQKGFFKKGIAEKDGQH